jgi:peptidylprolyl isomerase
MPHMPLSEFLTRARRIVKTTAMIGGTYYLVVKARHWYDMSVVKDQSRYIKDKVYMDVGIGERYAGRIIFGLYTDVLPMTCENFVQLCRGYKVGEKEIGYKNTTFVSGKQGLCLFGGDTMSFSGSTNGMSIFGDKFPDESFAMSFRQDGDLAMDNTGPNTNGSKFLISLAPMFAFNGLYVVFGTVLKGMKVVRKISEQVAKSGRMVEVVRIIDCGIYDDQNPPPVPEHFLSPFSPPLNEADWERQDQIEAESYAS